jgi:hypothetical protein
MSNTSTAKKRKILKMTNAGASLTQIQKACHIGRPCAIKYRRLYRSQMEETEKKIVEKLQEETPKMGVIQRIKGIFIKTLLPKQKE